MQIAHSQEENKGQFYIADGDEICAKMTYAQTGNTSITINHTEVDDLYKGKGFGIMLLEEAINFIRKNNLKVIPLCPFVKAAINKHPEFQDILK